MKYKEYNSCNLCPRNCGVDRNSGKVGFCKASSVPKIGRASLHNWEEPCISGENGSGTVFFSACTMRCCYCQNYKLSRGNVGIDMDADALCDIFIKLQEKGAHNINLVTAEHFAPHIREAVQKARESGLKVPVILNSSGYVNDNALELLKDVVDIYLVDFKYMDSHIAEKYSIARDYPEVIKRALEKMISFHPELIFDEDGILKKGVIVRHLCLPEHTEDSKKVIEYVFNTYGERVRLSIMSQFTPVWKNNEFSNLNRKLSEKEYNSLIDYCIEIGIEDAYIQEGESANESFIPDFYEEGKENVII